MCTDRHFKVWAQFRLPGLGDPKSNLYYHMFCAPEETVYEKHDQELKPAILEICQSSKKRIGSEKIRQRLIEQGFTVSKRKVLQLLRELQPQYLTGNKHHQKNPKWQEGDQNLLCRNFAPEAPNMVWTCDFTELKTDYGTYYLCAILDLFARKLIAARLSSYSDASLACITFQDAFQVRGQPDSVLFHTDRGTQFTSNEFRALLNECHVTQSFSLPGVPYDNAPMESFFCQPKSGRDPPLPLSEFFRSICIVTGLFPLLQLPAATQPCRRTYSDPS